MADPNGPDAAATPLPQHPRKAYMGIAGAGGGDLKKRIRPKPSPQGVVPASTSTANEEEELLQQQPQHSKTSNEDLSPQNLQATPRSQSVDSQRNDGGVLPSTENRPAKRLKPAVALDRTTSTSTSTEPAAPTAAASAPPPASAIKTPDMAAEQASGLDSGGPPPFALERNEQRTGGPKNDIDSGEERDKAPVAHVTRNESSGSVSSVSSTSSNRNNSNVASYDSQPGGVDEEEDPSMFSPVPKAFVQDVPPAPPSTPASSVSASWDHGNSSVMTPLPISTVHNAQLLEEQHMLLEGAVTPAPHREGGADDSTSGGQADLDAHGKPLSERSIPLLPGEFEDWAVGDRYEMVRILGRGSYGEVAQALDLKAGRPDAFVAIKRIQSPFDQEVDAVRLYREMHILRHMRGHDCIIQLLNVIQPPTDDLDDFHDLYLVFEYVDTDLYKLIMSPQYLTTQHIQTFLYQMLAGIKYIHSSSVIHRDLKPANILLNEDCSLKICDFGLARIVETNQMFKKEPTDDENKKPATGIPGVDRPPLGLTRQLTKHVVTRWYRAPELILIQPYTSAVDIWSLGCILGELLSMQQGNVATYQDRNPLFPGGACFPLSGDGELKGDEKVDQLSAIFGVLGTPSAEDVASIGKANEYIKSLGKMKPKRFEDIYPAADPLALDLLKQMLQFNPQRRCTAAQAMEHEFFRGVRHQELEMDAKGTLKGPEFLEKTSIDLKRVKQETYNEVLWYKCEKAVGDSKPPAKPSPNT